MNDVNLNLWPNHIFMRDAIVALRPETKGVFKENDAEESDLSIIDMLWYNKYPATVKDAAKLDKLKKTVREKRQKMKMFLEVSIEGSGNNSPRGEFTSLYEDPFQVQKVKVKTYKDMLSAINAFLKKEGKDIAMPVILISGKGHQSNKGDIILKFSSKENVSSTVIHNQYKSRDQLRIMFSCDPDTDHVDGPLASTNATLPITSNSKIVEMQIYAKEAVGDGPLNQNIKQ